MSCFKGRMSEYRNISLDRFDGNNLKSTAYFLSHCHEDHMAGLSSPNFISRLKESSDVYLYCSDITKILLVENSKYQHLEKYIKTLPVNHPVTLSVPQTSSCKVDYVHVTLLPAAHCPGSVMFLFEGSEGTALYTGDFRWEMDCVSKINALHSGDSVKPIQSLYIDTTFCHPDFFHIPSRDVCVEAVSGLVKEWLTKGQGYVVHFTPRSQYGHEHLLKEIARRMKLKIHVSSAKLKIYEQIADLFGVFTADPDSTPIHACLREKSTSDYHGALPCNYVVPKNVTLNKMVILPSTMYFIKRLRLNLAHIIEKTHGIYRACYSFHSSYSEVRNLVTYLKPRKVWPNVKPEPDNSLAEVQKRLNHFKKLEHIERNYETPDKKFGTLRKRKSRKIPLSLSNDSDDLDFGSPDMKRSKVETNIITPVKENRDFLLSPPEDAVTPVKNENELSDSQSSYAGSHHDDSEMSDTGLCNLSDEQETMGDYNADKLSSPPQSLLEAIDSLSSSQEVSSYRVCQLEDKEQTVGSDACTVDDIPDFGEVEETDHDEENMIVYDEGVGKNGSKSVCHVVTVNSSEGSGLRNGITNIEQDAKSGNKKYLEEENVDLGGKCEDMNAEESSAEVVFDNCTGKAPYSCGVDEKEEVKIKKSSKWKKNESYDLFEDGDGFSEGEMEEKDCEIVSFNDTSGISLEQMEKRNFQHEKTEDNSMSAECSDKSEKDRKINENIEEESEIVQINPFEASQSSGGYEVTDSQEMTQTYDTSSYINEKKVTDKLAVLPVGTSNLPGPSNENSVICKENPQRNLHKLSSCDTPGTSRSVCQCVIDSRPQSETIVVEIQEEGKRELNTGSEEKKHVSSKKGLLDHGVEKYVAILDSDSDVEGELNSLAKIAQLSYPDYESDSDRTLPPSQEVAGKTFTTKKTYSQPNVKNEDVIVVEDDSSSSSSSSSSALSGRGETERFLLRFQGVFNRKSETENSADLGIRKEENQCDDVVDDSDVIDLTLSDSDDEKNIEITQ